MKILITNDDSISSPVLKDLAKWALNKGEVTVVAPKVEQSGKSQGIEIHNPMEVKKIDFLDSVDAYYVDSTPADCVRFGFVALKQKFDLVISGINRGFNLGKDIVYSGTIGAVFEASNFGANCIAISTDPRSFENSVNQLDNLYNYFEEYKLFDLCKIYNVNIPLEGNEIKITKQGGPYFLDDFICKENSFYLQAGKCVYKPSDLAENFDTDATISGLISVTPLINNRTNNDVFNKLVKLNK